MTPKEFNKAYLDDALECEKTTGINHIATLTQAALESGWGKYAPGNMFFGIKDTDGINGNEQLITTTEYIRSSKNPMPIYVSTTPIVRNGVKIDTYYLNNYAENSFKEIARKSSGKSEFLNVQDPKSKDILTDIFSKTVLHELGGNDLVEAYIKKYNASK